LEKSDFTGLKCPLPVLKAKRVINKMQKGESHQFLSDDPSSPIDFSHLCEVENLELNYEKTDEIYLFNIRKR
tara:strand:- start:708 stop:923 length:216 start_codon:yes stop_codon:yes gene_type:complete